MFKRSSRRSGYIVRAGALAALSLAASSGLHAAISSSGSVSPSPPQTAGADPVIGVTDIGRFNITPSSVVNSDVVTIGQQLTGIGYATVSGFDEATGSGAVWNTNHMVVGSFGTGTLEILDGAIMTVDFAGNPGSGDMIIGQNPDSVGVVLVSGRGSLLRIGDDTFVGVTGTGTLRIFSEGTVIATNDAATGVDTFFVAARGRVELSNGRLRAEDLDNGGAIVGSGRVDGELTISNMIGGRFEVSPGQRMVVNGGAASGLGFDNDGEVFIRGGEIEFQEPFANSNQAAKVTLRDGGIVRFPDFGFGFDSTSGVLATTAGVNDIFGTVRIQGAASRIMVAGNSTAVFHDPVTNSAGVIEVMPGATAVYLQGLTLTSGVLAASLVDPAVAGDSVSVEVAGGAQLGGGLQVSLANGYVPAVGDQLPVLESDIVSGTFSEVTSTDPGDGLAYHAIYTPGSVAVMVIGAGDKTWGVDSDGNSSVAANWLGGVAPGGVNDRAAFTTIITANRTVGIDAPFTAGSLYFDDDNGYVLRGSAPITLDMTTGNARIDVSNVHGAATHTIAVPLILKDNTVIDVAGGSRLVLSAQMQADPSVGITKSGAGDLVVRNVRADGLSIQEGLVQVQTNGSAAGASVVKTLNITSPGTLDLANNDLVVDNGSLAQVAGYIASGSLKSSSATAITGLGAIVNGSRYTTFSGQPVDAADVLVKYTYLGDANLDGRVNIADYLIVDRASARGQTGWVSGDFNYSGGPADGTDYFLMDQAFLGQGAPLLTPTSSVSSPVPEPAAIGLLIPLLLLRGRPVRIGARGR